MQGPILVFAESSGNEFRKSAFEAVTEARRLADLSKTEVHALSIGHRIKDQAGSLGKFGADRVSVADDETLKVGEKEEERDKHRWELDPASSEDYRERLKDQG